MIKGYIPISGKTRILAIDVGVGTQDILLYDEAKILENNIKVVLPSMTQILARRVFCVRGDILFYGETMGGGPLTVAISRHIKSGYHVYMTPRSAMTLRDDLDEVRKMGVVIIDEGEVDDYDCEKIETKDIDFRLIKSLIEGVGEDFEFNYIGIAVQDHGHSPEKSDREFRFEKIRETVEREPHIRGFVYRDPPEYFSRMRSAVRIARKVFGGRIRVVDTKIAAVVGAAHGIRERPIISVDVGNGHTLVALLGEEDRFLGILEHHTSALNKEKLEDMIIRFANGEISHREVYDDGGHGCYIGEEVGMENVKRILVTGPKRHLLIGSKISLEFANPMGDVMMTGPIGIVDLIKAIE
jgi:uncharacterized protein (DUF1786 family)